MKKDELVIMKNEMDSFDFSSLGLVKHEEAELRYSVSLTKDSKKVISFTTNNTEAVPYDFTGGSNYSTSFDFSVNNADTDFVLNMYFNGYGSDIVSINKKKKAIPLRTALSLTKVGLL